MRISPPVKSSALDPGPKSFKLPLRSTDLSLSSKCIHIRTLHVTHDGDAVDRPCNSITYANLAIVKSVLTLVRPSVRYIASGAVESGTKAAAGGSSMQHAMQVHAAAASNSLAEAVALVDHS